MAIDSYKSWEASICLPCKIMNLLSAVIAITALSRFIILQGKQMDASQLLYESIAIVLIALAIVVLRLRHSDKLGLSKKKKRK